MACRPGSLWPLISSSNREQTLCTTPTDLARISELHKKKRHLENDCYFQKKQLQHELTPIEFEAVTVHLNRVMEAEKQKSKERQKDKFDRLLKQKNKLSFQDRWIVNLSSMTISDQQRSVFSKGLNFAPTPNSNQVPEICFRELISSSVGRMNVKSTSPEHGVSTYPLRSTLSKTA